MLLGCCFFTQLKNPFSQQWGGWICLWIEQLAVKLLLFVDIVWMCCSSSLGSRLSPSASKLFTNWKAITALKKESHDTLYMMRDGAIKSLWIDRYSIHYNTLELKRMETQLPKGSLILSYFYKNDSSSLIFKVFIKVILKLEGKKILL